MADFDPYKILGLEPGASKDEAKKAQRQLAKKYHPDQYTNPVAKEMAEEKMSDINRAYDMIASGEAERRYQSSNNSTYTNTNYGHYGGGQSSRDYNPWAHRPDNWERNRTRRYESDSSCCDLLCCLCFSRICC
ncbi:MAG: DnaJ domain-containing protein [Eubacteriales bacterium]|nr:DnaJ domain-containing protein [Eubacteriales bacterium]